MDMGDTMTMGGSPMDSPLNASGVDFSNSTQAADFLGELLDDTELQVDGNMYASDFWYGVCAVIGICAFFNITQKITFRLRMRAAAANRSRPATPSNTFSKAIACFTAIGREAGYYQYTPLKHSRLLKVPPIGTVALLVGYLAWVLLLEFVNNDVAGAQYFTSLGVRAGWLGVAQVPLLILLAGKNNLIGAVSGVSYDRLNVLHRWVSRMLLLLATLHMLFLHLAWDPYPGLKDLEYATDSCIPTGWAVYAILIWMNISTLAPIRNWAYEFFVVQHIITFFGFIVAIMMHLPSTALYSRVYIFIPIGLYILDRIIRSSRFLWHNIRPGHVVSLTPLEGGVTRVRIQTKGIKTWTPGSHVFLSIPKFGIGQSHPATIASTPSSHDGELVFILKGHKGFTARLHKTASSASPLLPTKAGKSSAQASSVEGNHIALVDGPYGSSHNDFACFDTVLLIAGSTGTTFTLPILLDLASRAQQRRLPCKRVVFLWMVKRTSWTSWIASELASASAMLRDAGIELAVKVHVTCDDAFTTGEKDEGAGGLDGKDSGCACDKSPGPCCCPDVPGGDTRDSLSIKSTNSVVDVGPSREKDSDRPAEKEEQDLWVGVQNRSTASSAASTRRVRDGGAGSRSLPGARFHSGRPDFFELLWDLLEQAEGETGVAVCGPLGLSAEVRRTVVRCSDERAVNKGSGAHGIYLHSECFGW